MIVLRSRRGLYEKEKKRCICDVRTGGMWHSFKVNRVFRRDLRAAPIVAQSDRLRYKG